MFWENLSKHISKISFAILLFAGVFFLGVFAQRKNLPPIPQLKMVSETLSEFSTDLEGHPYADHLQPSRGQGSGVTVNNASDADSLVMMTGFFDEGTQIRLIKRDGTVVNKWSLDYFEHYPRLSERVCDLSSPLRVDSHGVYITPQGEAIFNYEYCGTVKLDQCGEVEWRVDKPTHHSIVPAEAGGYWVLGRDVWSASEEPDRFPPFSTPGTPQSIQEDTIIRLSDEGEVLEEFSIPALMKENGLGALLTANGGVFGMRRVGRTELIHANKVTELSSELAEAYPLFEAGDLAISTQKLNLVMVLDPVSKKIKWYQTGPWDRQHDPEFRTDGRLSIFNNNAHHTSYLEIRGEQVDPNAPRTTNIMAMDPVTRETEVIFGERPGQEMLSVIRGDHALVGDDGVLITEFNAGRVLEVDGEGNIVWEYVNFYDEEFVGEITNALLYPADYFETEWETCTP